VLNAINSKGALAFFATPSDLESKGMPDGRRVRLGGLVETGSVMRAADGRMITFRVTDGNAAVPISYDMANGPVPDLFREGQGVVVEGNLLSGGVFRADTLLAKHDERYMPPEVAEALKRSGHWQGEHPPAAAAAKP
jgi:cytochrome c-type biogenesis protein CcmE